MCNSWKNRVLGNMKASSLVLLATITICSSALVKPPSGSGNFELLILHNNDMHARFEQTSQSSGACTVADREVGKCYGGFPRVAHVVKEARMAAQSGQGPPVLYLNAGDTYTGTAWFTIYKWKIAAEFINALQPDAVSLGNHELGKESDDLSLFLENIHTTVLASNVVIKSAQDNKNVQKSVIKDIKGVKVGLVGYLTPNSEFLDTTGDVEYIDEVIALKEEVAKLKDMNVGIIIALGHSNLIKDFEIAKEVEGLDLVIAGQSDKLYRGGNTNNNSTNKDPIIITQESGRKVPVIISSSYNQYLGKLLTKFDNEGEIINYNSEPILLDSTIPQDEETLQILKSNINELTAKTQTVIGKTAVVLDGDSCKTEECNLGNLITDAIIYYYATRFEGTSPWTDASIAIIPGGDIAASIAPSNRPADITPQDLLNAIPTESSIVAVTMSGTVLNTVLEHSVATYSTKNPTGQMLQFSGIRAEYDLSKEPGSRLVNSFARCSNCFVPDYYVIDSRNYKVLMPASMANGAYGYDMLSGLVQSPLSFDEVTSATEFIELRSPVYPEVAGRVVLVNSEGVEDNEGDGEDGGSEGDGENGGGNTASGLTSTIFTVVLLPIALLIRNQ